MKGMKYIILKSLSFFKEVKYLKGAKNKVAYSFATIEFEVIIEMSNRCVIEERRKCNCSGI